MVTFASAQRSCCFRSGHPEASIWLESALWTRALPSRLSGVTPVEAERGDYIDRLLRGAVSESPGPEIPMSDVANEWFERELPRLAQEYPLFFSFDREKSAALARRLGQFMAATEKAANISSKNIEDAIRLLDHLHALRDGRAEYLVLDDTKRTVTWRNVPPCRLTSAAYRTLKKLQRGCGSPVDLREQTRNKYRIGEVIGWPAARQRVRRLKAALRDGGLGMLADRIEPYGNGEQGLYVLRIEEE